MPCMLVYFFFVSSDTILESEESEEIVEPYQFEPQANKSLVGSLAASTLGDGDPLGGGRLGNTVCSNE